MDSLLIEPVYAGPISYFKAIHAAKKIVFDIHSNYEKRSFRNRCEVLGANGVLKLSIPLEKGKHQRQLLKDVRISYAENWQKDHWVSICSAYRRSPFFEYFEEQLHPFYVRKFDFLVDLNIQYFEMLRSIIKMDVQYEMTEQYIPKGEFEGNDSREKFSPNKKFVTGPYMQVFADRTGFIPDLSILDVLFNLGTQTNAYLDRSDLDL